MNYQFSDEAKIEFDNALAFYESRISGLALEVVSDFEKTMVRLLAYPESAPLIWPNTRKALLSNFPFNIIYKIENDTLKIVAFMNQKRKPGYWKKRMSRNN